MIEKPPHFLNWPLTSAIVMLVIYIQLLLLTQSFALDTRNPNLEEIIAGPWRISEQNPIGLKNSPALNGLDALLCIIGADRTDGEIELVFLIPRPQNAKIKEFKFVASDNLGTIHNFVEVSNSTSNRNEFAMRVYQLETPAKTGFQIVSVAMIGSSKKGETPVSLDEDAAIRKQYSRARADMRSIEVVIEAYLVDNHSYPAFTTDVAQSIHAGPSQTVASDGWKLPAFKLRTADTPNLMTLTTPVPYTTRYPDDPFTNQAGHTYQFYSTKNGWILWSPGPDGKYDIDWLQYNPNPSDPMDTTNTLNRLSGKTYDPTNGTISGGDLWRIKQ